MSGTSYAASAILEDVGADHRRGYVAVAKELLHGADVMDPCQEVGGGGVVEDVASNALVETCSPAACFTARGATLSWS